MSVDFIKSQKNKNSLLEADKQQKQILYFTKSEIQDEPNNAYLTAWAERNYQGDDYFLNWIKSVFNNDNFMSVFKYMRKPLPSSRIVNNQIKPYLARVLYAEDSFFNYIIDKEPIYEPSDLRNDRYAKEYFNNWLFRTNDVYITDLKDVNSPYHYLVPVGAIVSIDHNRERITRISFPAKINDEFGELIEGFAYIDDFKYEFYNSDYVLIKRNTHDLGICPATFVGSKTLNDDFIVKENLFSYQRTDLEEYSLLKIFQKITDSNGTFPTITTIKPSESKLGGADRNSGSDAYPSNLMEMGSQVSALTEDTQKKGSPVNTGTIIEIDSKNIKSVDGNIDMSVVKDFINYFYVPVDILTFINKRISELEKSIVNISVANYKEDSQEGSKSDLHIGKTYDSAEDVIRSVSEELTELRTKLDFSRLALKHGKENVEIDIFCGSKFFMESEKKLQELYDGAPNSLERRQVLVKLNKNRNRFNPNKGKRESLLYDIIPYATDVDFEKALEKNLVSDEEFVFQVKFHQWISRLESEFGDLLIFLDSLNMDKNSKITFIKKTIINLIRKENEQKTDNANPKGL